MTVADLIAALREMPQEAEALIDDGGEIRPVYHAEHTKFFVTEFGELDTVSLAYKASFETHVGVMLS